MKTQTVLPSDGAPYAACSPNTVTTFISPETAQQMLVFNTCNRPINGNLVARIADEITQGKWLYNGQPIIFSNKGELLDGQHRLEAIVKAGQGARTDVKSGIDAQAFVTMDSGMARSGAQVLAMRGYKNVNQLASTVRIIHRYQTTGNFSGKANMTNEEVLAFVEEYPDVVDSLAVAASYRHVSPAISASCHYLFGLIDFPLRDQFFQDVISGIGLKAGDPALVLRERLAANKVAKTKMTSLQLYAFFIIAWNAQRDGRSMRFIKWVEKGVSRMEFPVPR